MIYGSICSGIEAATLAWKPLGWEAAFFSEIDDAPRAVLAHHYPDIPCHGDFTTIRKGNYAAIDLLAAGTPCQDFSVAGLRKGLTGDRGSLTIEFVRLLKRLRPTWFVFENVTGILSSDKGKAFGVFLGALGECGYGFAYRVLDAQHYGIPQRRRRVFVVGYFGDWRPPAAVLFESESLRGDSPPSRSAGQRITGTLSARTEGGGGLGTDFECGGGLTTHTLRAEGFDASEDGTGRGTPLVPAISPALKARDSKGPSSDGDGDGAPLIAMAIPILEVGARSNSPIPINTQLGLRGPDTSNSVREGIGIGKSGDPMFTLQAAHQHAVAFDCKASGGRGFAADSAQAPTLRAMTGKKANGGGEVAVAFDTAQITSKTNRSNPKHGDPCHTFHQSATHHVATQMAVRRLTPRECERLMGMPDDYTLVPYRGRMMADGPRYRMIGNSMAVPPMRKIGERIELITKLMGR